MKRMARADVPDFLDQMNQRYEVYAPQQIRGTTRIYAPLGAGTLALEGERPPQSPKGVFFPSAQSLFRYNGHGVDQVDQRPDRPISVFGLSAADAAGIEYLDRFFTSGYADDVYLMRRQDSIVSTLVGEDGNGGFGPAASPGLFDLQFALVDGDLYALEGSIKGTAVLEQQSKLFEPVRDEREILSYLASRSRAPEPMQSIARAAVLLRAGRVADEFWEWVAEQCLGCGGCSYVCPTCTCFDVWDRGNGEGGARYRSWDSCILAGFSREGSGHNPRGRRYQRNQRRIEHKLMWDGPGSTGLACVGCGRCEEVCPSGLGMPVFAREILQQADRRGQIILDVLERAADEPAFRVQMSEGDPAALEPYNLTPLEKAAIRSGDLGWIESYVTELDERQKVWIMARLEQEDWGFPSGPEAEDTPIPEPLESEPSLPKPTSAVDQMVWKPRWLLDEPTKTEPDLITVLERASRDLDFSARLLAEGSAALEGYDLTLEEKAAVVSGDIMWLEARLGPLTEEQKAWLYRRLEYAAW